MTFFPSMIDLWKNWIEENWERSENNIVFAWFVEQEQIGHTQMLEAETGLEVHEIVRRPLGRLNRITIFKIGRVLLDWRDIWEQAGRADGTV